MAIRRWVQNKHAIASAHASRHLDASTVSIYSAQKPSGQNKQFYNLKFNCQYKLIEDSYCDEQLIHSKTAARLALTSSIIEEVEGAAGENGREFGPIHSLSLSLKDVEDGRDGCWAGRCLHGVQVSDPSAPLVTTNRPRCSCSNPTTSSIIPPETQCHQLVEDHRRAQKLPELGQAVSVPEPPRRHPGSNRLVVAAQRGPVCRRSHTPKHSRVCRWNNIVI